MARTAQHAERASDEEAARADDNDDELGAVQTWRRVHAAT